MKKMIKTTFEVEYMRHNVTPAEFLAYVRNRVDKRGGRYLRGDLNLEYFAAGNDLNFDIRHEGGENDGVHEKSISRPYEMQTYIRYPNGAMYNEICEFEFDNEKFGTGYYYLVNVTVNETDAEAITTEQPKELITAGDVIEVPLELGNFTIADRRYVVGEVLYQEPWSWRGAYYIEFRDVHGKYHNWHQNTDGGRLITAEDKREVVRK